MPNVKISQLPAVTVPLAGTEELPVVQGGVTKRTAINNILNANTIPYIANGLGAVATPSYTFTGDLNTGMWSPGANTIVFSVGGVESMRIADTGYVGIGTITPITNLDMASGFANLAGTTVSDRTVNIGANRAISSNVSLGFYSAGNPIVADAEFIRYSGVNSNLDLINSGTGNITIFANGSERMRVTSAGNVGIGTSSPTSLLDVNGNAEVAGTLFLGASNHGNLGSDATQLFVRGNNVVFQNAAGSATYVYVNSTGNFGIGTTAPPQLLAVGNSTDQFGAGISGAVTTAYFGSPSSGSGGIRRLAYDRTTGDFNFIGGSVASPSTQMTINSTGSVGIGTSSPDASALLDVSSTTKGFLPPRMSTAQRDAIGGATQEGLIIYNVTTDKLQVFAAGAWVNLH